jgi:hypothetical protein
LTLFVGTTFFVVLNQKEEDKKMVNTRSQSARNAEKRIEQSVKVSLKSPHTPKKIAAIGTSRHSAQREIDLEAQLQTAETLDHQNEVLRRCVGEQQQRPPSEKQHSRSSRGNQESLHDSTDEDYQFEEDSSYDPTYYQEEESEEEEDRSSRAMEPIIQDKDPSKQRTPKGKET